MLLQARWEDTLFVFCQCYSSLLQAAFLVRTFLDGDTVQEGGETCFALDSFLWLLLGSVSNSDFSIYRLLVMSWDFSGGARHLFCIRLLHLATVGSWLEGARFRCLSKKIHFLTQIWFWVKINALALYTVVFFGTCPFTERGRQTSMCCKHVW